MDQLNEAFCLARLFDEVDELATENSQRHLLIWLKS